MSIETALLKEWASAVEAFLAGDTILALRKGGIREENRDFELTSESFYFFPTYEHQKEHLLKEPFRRYASETRASWSPDLPNVTIRAWAEAAEDILIHDEEQLRALSPYHIWTDDYASERLHWKRTKPLHCLLLRVHRLEEPLIVSNDPAFAGCKSWLRLPLPADLAKRPVLSDEVFAAKAEQIRAALR
ncbi:DUF1802 family protein [Paenibacillus sp.]|uniref:DUF1802 family protein n=1 Tax=Paenibacillus sp. TaxID=58172 RepID=UPI002D32F93B|nr:DUF1802 family protein [Paenibacillus sp.]HZG83616.1 DUF1802 family protein [Paenibacillus sp.]